HTTHFVTRCTPCYFTRLLYHVREETEKPCPLDCLRQLTLPLGRHRCNPARHDLAPLRDKALQQLDVLIVDFRRVGTGKRARFPATEKRTPGSSTTARRPAGGLAFHLCLHRFRY